MFVTLTSPKFQLLFGEHSWWSDIPLNNTVTWKSPITMDKWYLKMRSTHSCLCSMFFDFDVNIEWYSKLNRNMATKKFNNLIMRVENLRASCSISVERLSKQSIMQSYSTLFTVIAKKPTSKSSCEYEYSLSRFPSARDTELMQCLYIWLLQGGRQIKSKSRPGSMAIFAWRSHPIRLFMIETTKPSCPSSNSTIHCSFPIEIVQKFFTGFKRGF